MVDTALMTRNRLCIKCSHKWVFSFSGCLRAVLSVLEQDQIHGLEQPSLVLLAGGQRQCWQVTLLRDNIGRRVFGMLFTECAALELRPVSCVFFLFFNIFRAKLCLFCVLCAFEF